MFNRSKSFIPLMQTWPSHLHTTGRCFSLLQQTEFSKKPKPAPTFTPLHILTPEAIQLGKIKNRLSKLIDALLTHNYKLKVPNDLPALKTKINQANTEAAITALLYPTPKTALFNLKSWKEVKHNLLNKPLFNHPKRHLEQWHCLTKDPDSLGIAFKHNTKLLTRYTQYLHFLSKHARTQDSEYITEEECYQDALNELTDALSEGEYTETSQKLAKQCEQLKSYQHQRR